MLRHYLSKGKVKEISLKKNILLSILIKLPVILIELTSVRLMFLYLEEINYGLLITIYSFSSWLSFVNLGIGSTLITKISSSLAKGNINKAKSYISTAFFTLSLIVITLITIIFCLRYFVNFSSFINIPYDFKELNFLVTLVLIFGVIQYSTEIIKSILVATGLAFGQTLIDLLSKGINLCIIFLLTKNVESSLLLICIYRSFIFAFIPFLIGVIFFKLIRPDLRPNIKNFDVFILKDIWRLSAKFLFIQIFSTIIFSSDNIIINQIFGPSNVAIYGISGRYFRIVPIFLSLFVPVWNIFAKANSLKEKDKLRSTLKKLFISFMPIIPISFCMIIFGKFIINELWMGKDTQITIALLSVMAVLNVLQAWNRIFNYFLNGVGMVNTTLLSMFIGAIINIPLSIFFAKSLNLGIIGVTLGTIISLSVFSILGSLKTLNILKTS